ncbi:hypothetical protein TNCV_4311681 [Trichonephila clavipes]|nr:hypothetical protein TNCV_4311681 [Trichonephila clavipes]
MCNDDSRRRNWRDAEVMHRISERRNNYTGNYESGPQRDWRFENGNRVNADNRRFNANTKGYQSGNRGPSGNVCRGRPKK